MKAELERLYRWVRDEQHTFRRNPDVCSTYCGVGDRIKAILTRSDWIPVTMQHSSDSNEHYTPPAYVESARKVMGSIDLDPASCQAAQSYIRAAEWCGLDHPDPGYRDGLCLGVGHGKNVFLNPPGGLVGRKSSAAHWWCVYRDLYLEDRIRSLFFVGFNLSLLRTTQQSAHPIIDSDVQICIPRERICFLTFDGQRWHEGKQPKYDNLIAYCGPNPEGFREETGKYGAGC